MVSKTDEKTIVIGRFGAPFGVKGWLKVNSFTVPEDNILAYQPWFADLKDGLTEIKLLDHRKHHKGIVVQIEGCEQKEETAFYRNASIAVKRSVLPELEDGEYYWSDLAGLTVNNIKGETLGVIDHVFATGANDVLVVKGDSDILIPYVKESVVKSIDLTAHLMVVDWDPEF